MLCGGWAFWLIAMMKVICCKFSQSRWRIDRRCFLRSFSAKARRALERVISKPCSKPSSASKPREAICNETKNSPLTFILSHGRREADNMHAGHDNNASEVDLRSPKHEDRGRVSIWSGLRKG